MPKGYYLSAHRSEGDPVKKAAYAKFAIPAIKQAGGRILARVEKFRLEKMGGRAMLR